MNKTQNILFYTVHPNDEWSRAILQELSRNPLLNEQFVKICVSNPNLRLPRMIMEYDQFPLIVTKTFRDKNDPRRSLIGGADALSWIKEGAFSGKAGEIEGKVIDFGDMKMGSQLSEAFGKLLDEHQKTGYHQQFNDEYNLGIDNDSRTLNSLYTGTRDTPLEIDTIDEDPRSAKSKALFERKLKQVEFQRKKDVPDKQSTTGGGYLSRGAALNPQANPQFGGHSNMMGGAPFAGPGGQMSSRGGFDPRLGNGLDGPSLGQQMGNMDPRMNPGFPQNQNSHGNPHLAHGGGYARPPPIHPNSQNFNFPNFPLAPNEREPSQMGRVAGGYVGDGGVPNQRMPHHPSIAQRGGGAGLGPGAPRPSNFPTANFGLEHEMGRNMGRVSGYQMAHDGRSMMNDRPMETRFNTRRNISTRAGLPSGMGSSTPYSSGMNTHY